MHCCNKLAPQLRMFMSVATSTNVTCLIALEVYARDYSYNTTRQLTQTAFQNTATAASARTAVAFTTLRLSLMLAVTLYYDSLKSAVRCMLELIRTISCYSNYVFHCILAYCGQCS
jgi:hypothetical protein